MTAECCVDLKTDVDRSLKSPSCSGRHGLPAGLTLSSSGVLSGTPNAALAGGNCRIYITATEKVTKTVNKVTTVTTKAIPLAFQISIS